MEIRIFTSEQLEEVDAAVSLAEELVSNFYKMSSSQWLRNRYDVRTATQLSPQERVEGPFAQVVGYEARRNDVTLGSCVFNYYRICLQDGAILRKVEEEADLELFPFLLYILIHELVHIVRFGTFATMYEASSEAEEALDEERKVHDLTWRILNKVKIRGMSIVLNYYTKWRTDPIFDKLP